MLSHNSIENYYLATFTLMQHHKYSLSDIENMIPFELDTYMGLLKNHLDELEKSKNA